MTKDLKIKVCGMKYSENREKVEHLQVDLLGYIFYPPSKRYVGEDANAKLFNSHKSKVAVFVNESVNTILQLAEEWDFEFIQLHGNENPQTCEILKKQGLKIIKAFSVDEPFNFAKTKNFSDVSDYFLFDTKTKLYGGSGKKFNWEILERYEGKTPFFLSGGIGPDDAESIKRIKHLQFTGVDLNSGFEDEPGVKNVEKLQRFIQQVKQT